MLCSLHAQPEWVKTPALGNDMGEAVQPLSNSSAVICCCGCQVAQDVSLTISQRRFLWWTRHDASKWWQTW